MSQAMHSFATRPEMQQLQGLVVSHSHEYWPPKSSE